MRQELLHFHATVARRHEVSIRELLMSLIGCPSDAALLAQYAALPEQVRAGLNRYIVALDAAHSDTGVNHQAVHLAFQAFALELIAN